MYFVYVSIGTLYEVSIRLPCNHNYSVMEDTLGDNLKSKSIPNHNIW